MEAIIFKYIRQQWIWRPDERWITILGEKTRKESSKAILNRRILDLNWLNHNIFVSKTVLTKAMKLYKRFRRKFAYSVRSNKELTISKKWYIQWFWYLRMVWINERNFQIIPNCRRISLIIVWWLWWTTKHNAGILNNAANMEYIIHSTRL